MGCCSPVCRKWTAFGFSLGFLISGFMMIFGWDSLFHYIENSQLKLKRGTFQYKAWLDAPVDIFMELHVFNWVNFEEFEKSKKWTKPQFEELGPYTFSIRLSRTNVKFNDNNTVSYNTIRTYKFVPERSKGSLDDVVKIINPVQMTMASILKDKHYLLQRGTDYFFKRLKQNLGLVTTVKKLTFEGVSHPAMDFAARLKLMEGYELPFDKFGWFYARNGSASYEGDYTIFTGDGDIKNTGVIDEWNHSKFSKSYTGECGRIDASTGDVFHPVGDDPTFSLFQSDFCGKVTLERNGSDTKEGIEGNLYISTDKMLDNGIKYPEMSCFNPPGKTIEIGLRNLTACQYRAPAFLSLPHFYLGDESLREAIGGMNPDPEKHQMYFLIEPNLGIPLKAQIVFQANMKLFKVKDMELFKDVETTMIPLMWIHVSSGLPDSYVPLIKLSFIAQTIGNYLGYLFVVLGVILFILGVFMDIRERKGELSYKLYLRRMMSKSSYSISPLVTDSTSDERKSV